VLMLLEALEDKLPSASYWQLLVEFSGSSPSDMDRNCRQVIGGAGITVKSSTVGISRDGCRINFVLKSRYRVTSYELIEKISALENVCRIEWSHRSEAL